MSTFNLGHESEQPRHIIAWIAIVVLLTGGGVVFYFSLACAHKYPVASDTSVPIGLYAFAMWGLAASIFALKYATGRWLIKPGGPHLPESQHGIFPVSRLHTGLGHFPREARSPASLRAIGSRTFTI